jgi:hypothetical protein
MNYATWERANPAPQAKSMIGKRPNLRRPNRKIHKTLYSIMNDSGSSSDPEMAHIQSDYHRMVVAIDAVMKEEGTDNPDELMQKWQAQLLPAPASSQHECSLLCDWPNLGFRQKIGPTQDASWLRQFFVEHDVANLIYESDRPRETWDELVTTYTSAVYYSAWLTDRGGKPCSHLTDDDMCHEFLSRYKGVLRRAFLASIASRLGLSNSRAAGTVVSIVARLRQ